MMKLLLVILLLQVLESVCIQENQQGNIPSANKQEEQKNEKPLSVKKGLPSEDDWMDCSDIFGTNTISSWLSTLKLTVFYYCGKTIGIDEKTTADVRKVTIVIKVFKLTQFLHDYTLEDPGDIIILPTDTDDELKKKAKSLDTSIVRCETQDIDAGKSFCVKYYNNGEWWCHTFTEDDLNTKKDVDKCDVLDQELKMMKDKEYNTVGPKRFDAKGYTDCSDRQKPHIICEFDLLILTAHYLCSTTDMAYKLVATYNNMALEEYLVSNSFMYKKPLDIKKVCGLFQYKIENKGATITIQYFKKGNWICNVFNKIESQEETIYKQPGTFDQQEECPRFRNYEVP